MPERSWTSAGFPIPRNESKEKYTGWRDEWNNEWNTGSHWNMTQAWKQGNNVIVRGIDKCGDNQSQ